MVEQLDETPVETRLGIDAGTKFALHAISKHLGQPDSRQAILWEIENWTEEFMLDDRFLLESSELTTFLQMIAGLPETDRRRFLRAKNRLRRIQDLAFAILGDIQGVRDDKPRRLRDVHGTPQWEAHRKWMKRYQREKKAGAKRRSN